MLRRLDFTLDAPAYELLQQSTLMTHAQFPIGELMVLADVQKKFAAIGVPKPEADQPPGGIIVLRCCMGGSVVLEEPEYAALVKAFDAGGWIPAYAERVKPVKELLTSLPEWTPPQEQKEEILPAAERTPALPAGEVAAP